MSTDLQPISIASSSSAAPGPNRPELELLQSVIDLLPCYVFWKNLQGTYLGCNRQFAFIAGLDQPGAIRGKSDLDLPWPRAQAEHLRSIDRGVIDNGVSRSDVREILRTADGREWDVFTSTVPLRNSVGQLTGVLGLYQDATGAKRNDYDLRTRLAAIDAVVDAVVITNHEGLIEYVNPAFTRMTGYSSDEVIGRNPNVLRSGQHDDQFYTRMWATIREGRVWHGELTNRRKDGSVYPEEMTITPVLDDGRVVRFVAIKRDITARRQQEVIERERATLKRAISAMEKVMGVVGHELRTPLAGVRAISEYLLESRSRQTAEFDKFLQGLHDEILRMSETVNDLLEAARLNSGRATWRWGEVDLVSACEGALAGIRARVDSSRINVEYSVEPEAQRMRGDRDAVRRLIMNLASNSYKHTLDGRISVEVRRPSDNRPGWVEIVVTDTGEGIPECILRHLGEAFALNSGVVGADHVGGAGLGLAICKGIAAAHGGWLEVSSALGKGTKIRARLRTDLPGPVQDEAVLRIV